MPDADLPALLARYERPLVRFALNIVGDLESARDVVQDTFIRFVQGRGPTETALHGGNGSRPHTAGEGDPLAAWLFTVTRNRALDVLRKNSRIIPMTLPDDRACESPGPASVLESRDTERSLLLLMDELPPNQREVIRLKFQNDLSYREIAEVTELSVTNVGFLLHTGLKKLRALITERAGNDFGLRNRHAL
jgi:RNA polymerase sigma factor (sigma-70 family)